MIELTIYEGDDEKFEQCYVEVSEIAAIRPFRYHQFRAVIGEIILKSGQKFAVWQTTDEIIRRIETEHETHVPKTQAAYETLEASPLGGSGAAT